MNVPARWLLTALSALTLGACSSSTEPDESVEADASETAIVSAGDVEAGRRAFGQCRSCHAVEAGVTRVGPSLFGVVGRPAGAVSGYTYSKAMADSGLIWTPETLDAYLENPQKKVKGTKMSMAGIADAQRRADVVAYLGTLK